MTMARQNANPTVLVVSTSRWFPIARLAIALADAGCRVEAVCPPRDPLSKSGAVERVHAYSGVMPLRALRRAILASHPSLVVPGDDLSVRHLHALFASERMRGADGTAVCELIERSFGPAESFPVVETRAEFMRLAQDEGVRIPESAELGSPDDLLAWFTRTGFPAVLKVNGTSGGEGVRIVRNLREAEETFRALSAPPLLARALKRLVVKHDNSLLRRAVLRRCSTVSVQSFITGREATSALACWEGKVLAGLHFEVLQKTHAFGPATVMHRIAHPEMIEAAQKIVRRLHLSGLHGLDYMIEDGTEKAYLIEINPRATQVGHLAYGEGHDLPTALHAVVAGQPIIAENSSTANDTVALFPQEWLRDPRSPWLRSAHHDVPWEAPALLRACLRRRPKRAAWPITEAQNQSSINSRPSPVVQLAKSNRDLDF